jgi:hypothetical protein
VTPSHPFSPNPLCKVPTYPSVAKPPLSELYFTLKLVSRLFMLMLKRQATAPPGGTVCRRRYITWTSSRNVSFCALRWRLTRADAPAVPKYVRKQVGIDRGTRMSRYPLAQMFSLRRV